MKNRNLRGLGLLLNFWGSYSYVSGGQYTMKYYPKHCKSRNQYKLVDAEEINKCRGGVTFFKEHRTIH